MKKRNNIKSVKRTGHLIFGLAIALLMYSQQPYSSENSNISTTENQAEQSGEQHSQAEYHILAYDVLLPVMQFNLFHSFDLLIEIPNLDQADFNLMEYIDRAYHNYFIILFRQIISPNAP